MLDKTTPKPIVPWMGGKRRLAKHLLPMFPKHTCYVEPFCGGAALFFMRPEPAKAEVLNDINGQLINLYRVVQHHFDEFVRQFEWTLTSREVFARLQSTPPECMTDIQRAARFFYLQHNAFGGKTVDQHFGTATTARSWSAADIASRLKAAQHRLGGVIIENEPWDKCFKRYDREHTFFYLDPPYWQTAGYDRAFNWAQYELLAKLMKESKGKAMLSINDHPDIRDLFKDFRTERLELAYSVSRDKTQKTSGELVICNW
ncbi:DNA adenine methylase [Bergeriella denitrificans]|uniref:site-specific DNA-methyltransferase (adenine-specific) n=1 Tax=Bergeriella denitrificans TaxID=494 RepID=A0A378UG26_BERDE|nr:DNA adenine methylase [Bergeriella denitrificans]STZ75319.1 putative phage associated type II DNA-methyltransferase [Bergeriella denitrificans]STZ76120.1 putative phage associated type II DNA-methyltransferase [Bergeriella denitrificans]